jgi:hypothetical protein
VLRSTFRYAVHRDGAYMASSLRFSGTDGKGTPGAWHRRPLLLTQSPSQGTTSHKGRLAPGTTAHCYTEKRSRVKLAYKDVWRLAQPPTAR